MTDQSANPKALVEHVAKALVNAPEKVFVDEFNEDGELVFELEVSEDDMGRVIGKGGKIARAMRNLLHASGAKTDQRFELEILE
ncbi:MAG TPA: KH domain-containing protein [Terriglobales bacterium]|nr:KH domain-containing protein [Terriglobales bacterium]